eukprot:Hpha_TRINITY_DN15982_c1_g18::TRINITY_DN15982_c1_g18_i1::g.75513::m.75513
MPWNEVATSAGVGLVVGATGGAAAIAVGLTAEYCIFRCCWKESKGRDCKYKAQEGCLVATQCGACTGACVMCLTPLCGLTTVQGTAITGATGIALGTRLYCGMCSEGKREPNTDPADEPSEKEVLAPQPCDTS